jgi:hypothetical protein
LPQKNQKSLRWRDGGKSEVTPKSISGTHGEYANLIDNKNGEVSERFKEHAWKACVGETQPWVRIPPSPPFSQRLVFDATDWRASFLGARETEGYLDLQLQRGF